MSQVLCMAYDDNEESGINFAVVSATPEAIAKLVEVHDVTKGLTERLGKSTKNRTITLSLDEVPGLDVQFYYDEDIDLTRDEADLICGFHSETDCVRFERAVGYADTGPIEVTSLEVEVSTDRLVTIHGEFEEHLETANIPIALFEGW